MAITNPVVKKVFEDLEAYRDFCRFEGAQVFDEKALYNRRDKHWQAYEAFLSGNKKKYFKPKKAYKIMLNIGVRPTVDGKQKTIEAHILDFNQNIYNQKHTIFLVQFLREEIRFNGLDLS